MTPPDKAGAAHVELTKVAGAKMQFLIKRRPGVTREALAAHWFANHMPAVIAGQTAAAEAGKPHARRYVATIFDPPRKGDQAWDGVAQLWFDQALPQPDVPHGTEPVDSFQQRAEPYVGWDTTEYEIIDGDERLGLDPNTLNDPFPCTRGGFFKVTFLVAVKADTDYDALRSHWTTTHATNAATVARSIGGWRYRLSLSDNPADEPYAGMAELYFDDADMWRDYYTTIEEDGMSRWVDPAKTVMLTSSNEFVGIP